MSQALPEQITFYGRDDFGVVQVRAKDHQRWLTFGNDVEQSCIDIRHPYSPVHVYLHGMLIAPLTLAEPRQLAILGLGGGTLANALTQLFPDSLIDGVDHRQLVIDAALSSCGLEQHDKLTLHCADANDFMSQRQTTYDVIFTDLYEANGAHELQTQQAFMATCAKKLAHQGVLVANQWASEFRDSQKAHAALNAVFGDRVIYLRVAGGNTIAFAYKDALPDLKRDNFYQLAQTAGLKIHCDLQRQARAFWRQNAETLQTGRYRKHT